MFRRGSRDVQLPPPTAGSVFMLLKLAMATATGEPCAWPRGAAIVAASPPRRCCPRWTAARTLGGASRSWAGGSAGPRPGLSSSWRSCRWCNVTGGRDLAGTARFPRDVTGSPALALGTGWSPGNPLCAGAGSPKSAPNGLQGPRSSRAGWSVRSWPAAGCRNRPSPIHRLRQSRLRRWFPARYARTGRRSCRCAPQLLPTE